jgi:hypothetical protein
MLRDESDDSIALSGRIAEAIANNARHRMSPASAGQRSPIPEKSKPAQLTKAVLRF